MEDPRYICFPVTGNEHSVRIQPKLLELGFSWGDGTREIHHRSEVKSLWIHLDEREDNLYYSSMDDRWSMNDRKSTTLLLTEEDLDWCIRNKKPLQKKPENEWGDGFDKVLQTINECWK